MKKQFKTKHFSDCQKSLTRKNYIIYGLQIVAGSAIAITILASIYAA
jgi:hypothetical protein